MPQSYRLPDKAHSRNDGTVEQKKHVPSLLQQSLKAASDPELKEASQDELAQGISELDPVKESAAETEAARNALDMLHENLVAVFAGEE